MLSLKIQLCNNKRENKFCKGKLVPSKKAQKANLVKLKMKCVVLDFAACVISLI